MNYYDCMMEKHCEKKNNYADCSVQLWYIFNIYFFSIREQDWIYYNQENKQ